MPTGRVIIACACGFAAAGLLATCWPGVVQYDGVRQYEQVLSGRFDDWHPPIMARFWSLLEHVRRGQGLLLVVQLVLTWLGLAMIADRLVRFGRMRAAIFVIAIGLCPLFSAWQISVIKDAQVIAALVCATGLACWREAQRPPWVKAVMLILFAYATLLRANAVFATVPLALGLLGWPSGGGWPWRAVITIASWAVILAVTPSVNHKLLGAAPSGVERSLLAYDIAGIRARDAGMVAQPWPGARAAHCVTPFFWDPLGSRCDFVQISLDERHPGPALAKAWVAAVAASPSAYLRHRLSHFNSTERWLVPPAWPSSAPGGSEPNTLGLRTPGPMAELLRVACVFLAATPLGWPAVWMVAAMAAFIITKGQGIAGALALSALTLEASFLVVSVASDLRYHLWPMVATALAWTMLRPSPRQVGLTLAACAVAAMPAAATRLLWPGASIDDPASLMPVS